MQEDQGRYIPGRWGRAVEAALNSINPEAQRFLSKADDAMMNGIWSATSLSEREANSTPVERTPDLNWERTAMQHQTGTRLDALRKATTLDTRIQEHTSYWLADVPAPRCRSMRCGGIF